MFSDISGLCARDAGSTPPPGVTARRVSRHRQMNMPGRQDVPGLRVTALDPLIREAQSVMASGDLAQVAEFLWLQDRAGQEGQSHGADRETPWAGEVGGELWVTPCLGRGADGGWRALF